MSQASPTNAKPEAPSGPAAAAEAVPNGSPAVAAAETPPAVAGPDAGAEPSRPIESLDAQLAELAEEMIEGDFADEDSVLGDAKQPNGGGAPAEPATAPAAPAPAVAPAKTDNTTPAAAAPAPAAQPVKAAATAPPAKTPPRPAAPATPGGVSGPTKPGAAKKTGAKVGERAVHVMALISRPLMSRPPIVRQAIGYVAIITAFYALWTWTYVLIIRSPARPEATTPVAAMAKSEEEAAQAERAERARAEERAAAKPATKAAEAKAPAKREQGGGH